MAAPVCDVAVVGAGIVGLAVADALMSARPGLRLVVLEKEGAVGRHQTGHNSGVIHSGLYYRPGSLKAQLCVEGAARMVRLCEEYGIAHPAVGKVVVATGASELDRLCELERRGRENGVPGLRLVSPAELADIEPHAAAVRALWSPHTAIVDYGRVAEALRARIEASGAEVRLGVEVALGRTEGGAMRLVSRRGDAVRARYVVNCAGLYADLVARRLGLVPAVRIVPFRGEYHRLSAEAAARIRGLIYPVPDPELPFLGVHLTPTVAGHVEAGPNAVWAWAREGYTRRRLVASEALGDLGYGGFWRLGRRYWRTAAFEYRRSFSRPLFAASLARMVPGIGSADLRAGGAGVRAQAISPDGRLVDDFLLEEGARALHVLNAPSPAATASLAIGRVVAKRVLAGFDRTR